MRVLFDQGTPVPLRKWLTAHTVSTAYEMGWSALTNGDLLNSAEREFDVFITTDQNLRHQQSMVGHRLAILVLPYANWPKLKTHVPAIIAAVDAMRPGQLLDLTLP